MENVTTKTKIILFVILLVAMILPFSNFEMADAAAKSEKADKKDDSKKETKKEKKSKDKDNSKKKEKKSKDKDNSKKKEKKSKDDKYDIKSNYVEKDLHNYEADKVLEKMRPFLQRMPSDNNNTSNGRLIASMNIPAVSSASVDIEEIGKLQDELEKVTKDHQDKIIDKELRKNLKKARQMIIDSGIPTLVLATGIDHLYIQLSKENVEYEKQIIKIMKNLPYKIEYGEGVKRSACPTTASDCNFEVGGIKIQIKTSILTTGTCSLSIPMEKDGVPGFLTAAHCFNGYSEIVYQPDTSSESYIIGNSNSTWRSFVDNGECDCAWIRDTSPTEQRAGIYAWPNAYFVILKTHTPSIGENAMLRGFHNNNGVFNSSDEIKYDDIQISDWWGFGKTTKNMQAFTSPIQSGDSGGAVFYGTAYIGIVVGHTTIDNELYVVFVPWDHITENISGLAITPHP